MIYLVQYKREESQNTGETISRSELSFLGGFISITSGEFKAADRDLYVVKRSWTFPKSGKRVLNLEYEED